MKKTAEYLQTKKQQQEKITALTCYDYPTAVLEEKAGIDIVFVGDSVGTNILGYADETEVTMADILHHLRAVSRGIETSHILADLPYGSYETPQQALKNAQQLVANGADCVKFEGAKIEVAGYLVSQGLKVCGHLGLLPQTQQKKAMQGKDFDQAKEIITAATQLEEAGAFMLVLELVPEELAKIITERVKIPTIGIGAGRYTDGQVLIVNDILGITPRKLKLAKKYQDYQNSTLEAIAAYKKDVEGVTFPAEANLRHLDSQELEKLRTWLQK